MTMTSIPKKCLTVAVATLVVGVFALLAGSHLSPVLASFLYAALPLSAVFFCASFITLVMEKEMNEYDQAEAAKELAYQRIPNQSRRP